MISTLGSVLAIHRDDGDYGDYGQVGLLRGEGDMYAVIPGFYWRISSIEYRDGIVMILEGDDIHYLKSRYHLYRNWMMSPVAGRHS